MVVLKPGFVIVEFVEHFVAHPVPGPVSEAHAARHVGEVLYLAGGGSPLALSYIAVLIVYDIRCGKTGTGAARHGTGAAGDAPAVKLPPHGMFFKLLQPWRR